MGSIAQYAIYCATPQFIFYTLNMTKDFYFIISSDESTTSFNENANCIKCGSAMNFVEIINKTPYIM